MLSILMCFLLKKITRRLRSQNLAAVVVGFPSKNPFSSPYLSKTPRNLIKPNHGILKVQKTSPKPEINPKQKFFPEFRYVFIGVFNVRKTHNSNSLVIWNLVT